MNRPVEERTFCGKDKLVTALTAIPFNGRVSEVLEQWKRVEHQSANGTVASVGTSFLIGFQSKAYAKHFRAGLDMSCG